MRYYITSAIPYVNAKPHLGHALEFTQADVISRYHRQKGDETFYITGADENSLKNVQAAEKLEVSVQQLCDANSELFKNLAEALGVHFDFFQRSSRPKHHASSQELWLRCEQAGDIYKKRYQGLYCVGCEAFYSESDLNENKECFEHPGKSLELVEEENYFFRLSKYQSQLEELIENGKYKIVPESRKNEALGFIRQGLEDFSISRSKDRAKGWGVPVPNDPSQIMYVWFDALNVYRSGAPDWWPANLHIIGKGILRFHAVYWPAILLSAQLPLPQELFVHGYITVNNQKMSKTLGNVVDPFELIEKYGADPIRYYLLREIPSTDDGDFSENKFIERYNADLANGIGNFTARVLTLAKKVKEHALGPEESIAAEIKKTQAVVSEKIESRRLHEALQELWRLISFGDAYINDQKPWEEEDDSSKQRLVISNCLFLLSAISNLLLPFLPETAAKIKKAIKTDGDGKIRKTTKPRSPLFPRL